MEKIVTFCRHQEPKTLNKSDKSNSVNIFLSPILLTLLCLIASYKDANAQSSLLKTGSMETHRHSDTEDFQHQHVSQSPRLLNQQSPPPPVLLGVILYGNQISLNGHTLPGAWLQQRQKTGLLSIHLSDGAVKQLFGVDLLDTSNPTAQPIQWFSSKTKPLILTSLLTTGYRYLNITNFAKAAKWQMRMSGNTLVIITPNAKLTNIYQDTQPIGDRMIVDLDRPTPWQISEGLPARKPQIEEKGNSLTQLPQSPPVSSSVKNSEWTITLDAIADPALVQRYIPLSRPATPTLESLIQQVEIVNNKTTIHLSVPFGLAPRVSSVPNPNRLIVEIRPDAMMEKNITWAPGLTWRQQFVNLGQERFPVVWLEMSLRASGIKLKPIWTTTNTLVGTAPLIQTAQQYSAVAAINGGYFNRNNRFPLGAIRRDDQWLSSPILNRGAIAWNDSGQFYIGRLNLVETLISNNNLQLPILTLNSGYVQSGIARYTPAWGATYTPLTDNEIILVVEKNQVINRLIGGKVGEITVSIPQDGYLLIFRGKATSNVSSLPIGSSEKITSFTTPADFSRYSHIVGAGPVLVQNGQIVLDGKGEKFSDAFIVQKAVRSGICTTITGNLMIAAVHNRAGGAGPTLAEHAKLMQLLGCVNALNLDGGSSTSLYLGGQLLDRSPNTAAPVHNGIGIFWER